MTRNWYAFRMMFRARPTGRPHRKDAYFDPTIDSIEERIVLFHAKDRKTALRKAEKESRGYAKANSTTNIYGQRVVWKRIGAIDSYGLDDPVSDGTEVFSRLEAIEKSESDSAVLRRLSAPPPKRSSSAMFCAGFIMRELIERMSGAGSISPTGNRRRRPRK